MHAGLQDSAGAQAGAATDGGALTLPDSWTGPDRRRHGTRRRYQAGCRCLPCRAAEADYRAGLRKRQAKGLPILGQRVNAKEAGARLRALLVERYGRSQIRQQTGLSYRTLKTLNATQRCQLKTLFLLRRAYRILLTDDKHLKHFDG